MERENVGSPRQPFKEFDRHAFSHRVEFKYVGCPVYESSIIHIRKRSARHLQLHQAASAVSQPTQDSRMRAALLFPDSKLQRDVFPVLHYTPPEFHVCFIGSQELGRSLFPVFMNLRCFL